MVSEAQRGQMACLVSHSYWDSLVVPTPDPAVPVICTVHCLATGPEVMACGRLVWRQVSFNSLEWGACWKGKQVIELI